MQNSENTIYSELVVKGTAETVIMNTDVVYSINDGFSNTKGKFIHRKTL